MKYLAQAAIVLGLAACRGGFEPLRLDGSRAQDGDAATDTMNGDGPTTDGGGDAGLPMFCNPLTTVTPAQCQAAFANPAGATDAVIHECALGCQFGVCYIVDKTDCPTCSCMEYVKSDALCDSNGVCTAPLSGTGCLGGNFYASPPVNCMSAGGLAKEGACILRYLASQNDC